VPAALAGAAIAEIAVLVLAVRWLGLPATVLAVLVTSVVGVLLLRREGVRAWRRFREAAERGEPPGVRVADGLVGLAGALLLVVPGFVTDLFGVLLLLPPGRPLARRAVRRVAEARMSSGLAGDVFGPRRVRVRMRPPRPATAPDGTPPPGSPPTGGTSQGGALPHGPTPAGQRPDGRGSAGQRPDGHSPDGPPAHGPATGGSGGGGEVLEGEIIDPDRRS
jgi:UPF0716 protein FxsA